MSKKTAPANHKAAATKRAESLEACYAQCRKLGRAVRFSFLRIFRHGLECSDSEAMQEFDRAVQAGVIVEVGGNTAGDVKIYLCKGVAYK